MNLRVLALLWVLILLALGGGAAYSLMNERTKLVSDIQLLFPTLTSQDTKTLALNKSVERLSDTLVFVLGHPSKTILRDAHKEFAAQLSTLQLAEVVEVTGTELDRLRALQLSMAGTLASTKDRKSLEAGESSLLIQRSLVNLYMPSSNMMGQIIQKDPLGLFQNYLTETAALLGSEITLDADGTYFLQLNATLRATEVSGMDPAAQIAKILQVVETLKGETASLRVYYTGSPFYADQIATTSKSEAILITTVATIGILLLLMVAFRSYQSILGAVITITSGVFTGAAVTFIVFETVHLIAVAFGASLVGVVVDYAIHYYATRRSAESAAETSSRIRRGTLWALLTTVLGFTALLFVDISILKQIAVYSIFGVLGAVASVLILLPQSSVLAAGRGLSEPSDKLHTIHYSIFKPILIPVFWVLSLGFAVLLGLSVLPANDSVGRLRVVTSDLSAAEAQIAKIGGQAQTRTVLIEGGSPEELLQKEEQVIEALKASVPEVDVVGISTLFPSMARQNQVCNLAAGILASPSADQLRAVIPGISTECQAKELTSAAFTQLPSMVRQLAVFDDQNRLSGHLLLLRSVPPATKIADHLDSMDLMSELNVASVYSAGFKAMRGQATWALMGGIIIVMIGFSIGFGLKKGLAAALVPTFAALASLTLASVMGSGVSLFSVMAAFLVYALGADYALFQLAAVKEDTARAYRAVGLSSLSTLLVFGLMAFSAIPVLQIMGAVVVSGVFVAWLIAPIASVYTRGESV